VYPVYIDPEVMGSIANQNSYKSDGGQYIGQQHVGNTDQPEGDRYWRTVVNFAGGAAVGKFIEASELDIYYLSGDTGAETGSVRVGTAWNYTGFGSVLDSYTLGSTQTRTDGTTFPTYIAKQFNGGATNVAFMLTGAEGTAYSHKRITTDLWVRYHNKVTPSIVTGSGASPANAATSVTLTPTLKSTATAATNSQLRYSFRIGLDAAFTASKMVYESPESTSSTVTIPEGVLKPGTTYYWRAYVRDLYWEDHLGQHSFYSTGAWSFTTNQIPLPGEAGLTATPGTDTPRTPQTVTSLTPALTVSPVPRMDSDSTAAMKYEFKIATGSDGKTGTIVTSPLLTPDAAGKVSWTVPEGTLQDGDVYTWILASTDGRNMNRNHTWTRTFKVDLRLGASGPSPMDTAGPVTVNLANGNANMSFGSPTVSTLGGPMGMSFSYNSQELPGANRGLKVEYFDARNSGVVPTAAADFTFTHPDGSARQPLLVRTDSSVSFNWGTDSPSDGIPADGFLGRWSGFITVPDSLANTELEFGVRRDDGVRLFLNDQVILDKWALSSPTLEFAAARKMGTSAHRIRLEYFERASTSVLELLVREKGDTNGYYVVPPDWFTKSVQTLPAGWQSSTPITGAGSWWVSAQLTTGAVILTDATGKTHTHLKASTGGFTPPAGVYDVVSLTTDGHVVLTDEAGTVHQFAADGKLVSSTPPGDGAKPASPVPLFDPRGVVRSVNDPVSASTTGGVTSYARSITFTYQGDAGKTCPTDTGAGYVTPPTDMLCRMTYPDGTVTNLFYNEFGQLAAIEDPGAEWTTFGYGTGGVLDEIRDSTANDWVMHAGGSDGVESTVSISYESTPGDSQRLRVSTVTLPAPDGITATLRPKKTYTYGTGQTTVATAGITGVTTSTYDSAWRQTSAKSVLGLTTIQQWHATKDLLLAAVDPAGRKSTRIYDSNDRVTHSYGPAPSGCYDPNREPWPDAATRSGCGIIPALTSTTYDAGLKGLSTVYFPNGKLAGAPRLFALGTGTADGSIATTWSGSPGSPIGADNWSMRMTGLIRFDTAGTYTLQTTSDDGVRVWVDDILVIDDWTSGSTTKDSTAITATAGQWKRIRVEHSDTTGSSTLTLRWKTPGASTFVTVPGTHLAPDYGLVTTTTAHDSTSVAGTAAPTVTASFTYTHPWLGQATSSTVDPSGLALTTSVGYESPTDTAGWLRRVSRALPGAVKAGQTAANRTTSVYWAAGEITSEAVCGVPKDTPQFGAVKSMTGPTPAPTGGQATGTPIVTSFIHDRWGRVAATKVTGDTDWSCTTFDARGRVTKQTTTGQDGTAAITTTTTFGHSATGPVVTVTGPGGTITTRSDLLGRTLSYTDASGTVTTPVYEPLTGRVASTTTSYDGTTSRTGYTYDRDGKVTEVRVDDTNVTTPTYTAAGELASVTYQGGATLTVSRDPAGRVIGQVWGFPNAPQISDQVARSRSGRVVENTLTRGDVTERFRFGYDTAGRLVTAAIPGHQLTYGFASTGGCGVNTAAGASGNRTSLTDVYTAPGQPALTTTTAYCYDWADQLTSTAVTSSDGTLPSGAVADGLTTGEIAYDVQGNTTRLGDMTTPPGGTPGPRSPPKAGTPPSKSPGMREDGC
jgi:YD repeat-containing protein